MAELILMPKLGLTMERGIVLNWKKQEGDSVERGEAVLEVETDKIINEVESPHSGTLLKILVEGGTEVEVRAALAVVGKPGEDISTLEMPVSGTGKGEPQPCKEQGAGETATDRPTPRRRITPRAKKFLADHGLTVDALKDVQKERISEADVRAYLERRAGGAAESLQPLTPTQRVVATRMTESFRDIPQFSLRFVVAMDHLLNLLVLLQAQSSDKISINHLLLRATALALSRNPDVQRQFRPEGLYRPSEVNLGVATAVGDDLLVPVIHNADQKRLVEIAREAAELAEQARTRKLLSDQMSGGTFTVTNLGMYSISSFTPIVNPGEGGILGIGAVGDVPRIREGKLAVGKAVELTLVCDHRSVNGVIAAAFCRTFKEIAENEQTGSW